MKLILGTGKSIICSQLVSTTQANEKLTAVYFLCNHRDSGDHEFLRMMRYMAYQILRSNVETVPIVHQLYVLKGLSATTLVMKALLRQLASGVEHMRCIIDGLDECDRDVQTEVIKLILELRKASGSSFRALISSRDLPQIDRHLRPKITMSLFQKPSRHCNYTSAMVCNAFRITVDVSQKAQSTVSRTTWSRMLEVRSPEALVKTLGLNLARHVPVGQIST